MRKARYKGPYDHLHARWLTRSTPDYSVFLATHGPNSGMGHGNPEIDDDRAIALSLRDYLTR